MSSIQASYNTNPHGGTRAKNRHESKPALPQPPFRFRDLPLEICNEIYRLCLVDEEKIAIESVRNYDGDMSGNDEHSDNDKSVQLIPSRRHWRQTWGLNVLLIDKATYQEAVAVLYGFNEFQFHHRYPWRDLDILLSRLPESSRRYLRRLDIKFLDVERVLSSMNSLPHTEPAFQTIKRLPKLTTLTLRVTNDIMSRDLEHIRWINKYKGKSKVLLQLDKVSTRNDDREEAGPSIRISAAVVRLLNNFKWVVLGDFEIFDERNPFGDEEAWLKCLYREWMWRDYCLDSGQGGAEFT